MWKKGIKRKICKLLLSMLKGSSLKNKNKYIKLFDKLFLQFCIHYRQPVFLHFIWVILANILLYFDKESRRIWALPFCLLSKMNSSISYPLLISLTIHYSLSRLTSWYLQDLSLALMLSNHQGQKMKSSAILYQHLQIVSRRPIYYQLQ